MAASPSNTLRVKVLNVGQGDAIVTLLPGCRRALLIDACDGDRVLKVLEDEAVEEVVIFLTHSDRDHVAGIQYVIQNFSGQFVAFFYNRDRLEKSKQYVSLIRALASSTRDVPPDANVWSDDFNTGLNFNNRFSSIASAPVTLEVLHPEHSEQSSLLGTSTNEASGVMRLTMAIGGGQERSILFAGDVQLTGVSCMMNRLQDRHLAADVLKYPHHGAWPEEYPGISQFPSMSRSTMSTFLKAVNPEIVILSVGADNVHNHVRPEVFAALANLADEHNRLRRLLCTQVTSACTGGKAPVPPTECAGDIEVQLGPDIPNGLAIMPPGAEHAVAVERAVTPGCKFLSGRGKGLEW